MIEEPEKLRLIRALPRFGIEAGAIGDVISRYPLSRMVTMRFGKRVLMVREQDLEPIPEDAAL